MDGVGDRESILREAGLIDGPLPPAFSEFIEGMSNEEIEVLVDLKRRLDKEGIPTTTFKVAMPVL